MLNRREFHQRLAAAGGALFSAGFFAGCEERREITKGSATGSKPGDKAQTKPAAKRLRIGMIAKSQSNPVFIAARKGAEVQAAELSKSPGQEVSVDWRTPNDEDAQKQAEFIEQLVASGVDAITIACSDASKVTRAINDAVDKGVSVMCFDSDAPDSKRLCYVGTDDEEAGRLVMRHTARLIGERQGSVAVLAGNQTATNLQKRVRGALGELENYPNLKLKEVYYHKETPQDSYAAVESAQKANPDLVGWAMIGGWPLMTERALPWTPGEVICVSMDTLIPQLKHLRMGDVQLLLGQQYFYFGTQCVNLLVRHALQGKKPEKLVDFAPLDVVTKENVDDYEKNWAKWS
jgi:ribose transport system substrate-binding protein